MKRTTLITAMAIGLGAAGVVSAGALLRASAPEATSQVAAAEDHATFVIENMTCATCPITVRKAMQRVDGVKSVSVDFDSKTAVVVFDPSRTTVAPISAASTNAGYPARAVGA